MLGNIEMVVCRNHEEAEVMRLIGRKEEANFLGSVRRDTFADSQWLSTRKKEYSLVEGQRVWVILDDISDTPCHGQTFSCFPHFSHWLQSHLLS